MPNNRLFRINDDIQFHLSQLLQRIKDPRVAQGGLMSITRVDTTGDGRQSRVYLSVLGEVDEREMLRGLKSAAPYLRRELGSRLHLRFTPELLFILDHSLAHGAHIGQLMHDVDDADKKRRQVESPEACASFFQSGDDFCLLTHVRPDGDTLGSAAALCHALRRLGKNAWLWDNPEIPEHYRPYVQPYLREGALSGTLVSIDLADEHMLPHDWERLQQEQGLEIALCIDHHGSNSFYARRTLVMPEMAACGQVVLRVLQALCGEIDAQEASLLYVALSTDCGCFCYGNTDATAHTDAAYLATHGADLAALNKDLFRSASPGRIALEGLIYSSLQSYCDGRIHVACISREMVEQVGATDSDFTDLASLPGRVRGNQVAITVRELADGRSKGSVRTTGEVDASQLCAQFQGGGHRMAAGCVMDLPLQELAEQLRSKAEEALRSYYNNNLDNN